MSLRNKVSSSLLLLLAAVAVGLVGVARAQQGAPLVVSNIDQAGDNAAPRTPAPNAGSPILLPEDFSKAQLTPGTLLSLQFYRAPEMSTQVRVNEAGQISVPLLGKVDVTGKTTSELETEIASEMVKQGFLTAPQLNIDILQFAALNTSVLGEVHLPGRVTLLAPKPLPDVLALAGGETLAAGSDIEIDRTSAAREHVTYPHGSSPEHIAAVMVNPGDTVYVHRAGVVYVLGAVTRPGGYLMVDGGSLDLTQAIALAQGTTLIASTDKIWIVRRQQGAILEIPVEYSKMVKGRAATPPLKAGDVVYVAASKLKAFLVNGSGVLSAATSASIYAISAHP